MGTGDRDPELIRIIGDSGYKGPIGILGHTMDDAEDTLADNLSGLRWLLLDPAVREATPIPPPRVGRDRRAEDNSEEIESAEARAALPEFQVIPAARPDTLAAPLREYMPERYTDWHRSHGDAGSTRFSSLEQINRTNVGDLVPAWIYHSGDGAANIQCNPIIVNGVMYAPTAGDALVAVDGTNGRELWRFLPGAKPAHRGLLYRAGDSVAPARLFVNAGEYLYALDPESGKPIVSFGEGGRVRTGAVAVAGAVHGDIIVIPGLAGNVYGHDVVTGESRWEFHTIPRADEPGADTWREASEGANCWGGMAMDTDRSIAYIATGSPKPNFIGRTHHGRNLYANCVIALDTATGRLLWYFQDIRHDIWDLDLPAPPVLVTVERDGIRADAVAQLTKTGNTLLLDRVSGKPLFPFRLRRAPVSTIPGERTWPYQPDPVLPEPFVRQTFTREDITSRTTDARDYVASLLVNASTGWHEPVREGTPTAFFGVHGGAEWTGGAADPRTGKLYITANEIPWIVTAFRVDERRRDPALPPTEGQKLYQVHCAQCHGADRIGVGTAPPLQGLSERMREDEVHELIRTGRNLMPANDLLKREETDQLINYLYLRDFPDEEALPESVGNKWSHNGYPKLLDHEGYPGCTPPWGVLVCLNLNTGRIEWRKPLGYYPDLAEGGLTHTGAENFGGATVTAGGLVFCAGTPDALMRAFDSETGEELWSHELPFVGSAPPAVYEADGRQYVVIAATGGGKLGTPAGDAWVAFALPGAQ